MLPWVKETAPPMTPAAPSLKMPVPVVAIAVPVREPVRLSTPALTVVAPV